MRCIEAPVNNKKQYPLHFLVAALFSLLASFSYGQTYTVGVESVNHYPHYDFTQNEPRGYLVDLMREFARDQNMQIRFKVMPVEELWAAYIKKEVDFRLPDNLLWQRDVKRDAQLTYSAPLVHFTDGVLSLAKNDNKPVNSLGTIKGFTAWDFKDQIDRGLIRLDTELTAKALLDGLIAGKYDGVYYNVEAFKSLLKESGLEEGQIVFRKDLKKTRSLYMLSSIDYGPKVLALNQFLRANKQWVRERKAFYDLK